MIKYVSTSKEIRKKRLRDRPYSNMVFEINVQKWMSKSIILLSKCIIRLASVKQPRFSIFFSG